MKPFFKIAKGFFAFRFSLFAFSVNAQVNYVPNPGFEKLDSCVAQFQNAFTWPYIPIQLASPWDTLKNGGGNVGGFLCNKCFNPNQNCGVPKNAGSAGGCGTITGSYQVPHSGNGYLYIEYFKTPPANSAWRTYAQSPLTNTLITGKIYCVTYFVSLSNRSNAAIDEISAYLDDGTIQSIAPRFEALATPQIKSPTGVFFMDTLNWMKIQGTFTATGNESYITLGNFRTPTATNYTLLCFSGGVAEYYVDDVSVIDLNLSAYAGPDKYIISGDSTFIGRPPEIGLECTWYNGTVTVGIGGGIWVKPNTTTTYIVQQNICGLIKSDTVTVTVGYIGINEICLNNKKSLLSPNPNNGEFNITFLEANIKAEIFIYDISGKLIFSETKTSSGNILKLNSDLVNGIYLVKVKLSDGSIDVHRLIINK